MWTITGPFDGALGDISFQKTKLLKTGTTYGLGRKECPLLIVNKKVSSHQYDIEVKEFSIEDVGSPTSRPKLEFSNMKDKPARISRDGKQVDINPHETHELQDGDMIAVVSSVTVIVNWVPICCYVQPVMGKSAVSLKDCAALGVHVVHIPDPHVTHHILHSYTAQPIVAASLLSACHFAKIEWLTEVIRLGGLPNNPDSAQGLSFEYTLNLPPINKYRPIFSPTLPTSQKEFRVWEPNEERLMMFSEYRFLYVDEKARFGDYKELIERGGGSFETFDAAAGKSKFHRALTRGRAKEGKKTIIVGKERSLIAAIGKEAWRELVEEAKSFELRIVDPEVIVQVTIDVDTSLFDTLPATDMDVDSGPQTTSLPDFIPNTHSEEPSVVPPEPEQRAGPSRRLVRRTTSRQASQEPASLPSIKTPEPEQPNEVPRPRKALVKRVNAGVPLVIGLDDPSAILDSVPDLFAPPNPPPQAVVLDLTAPTPLRPTRLKRRLGTSASDTMASQAIGFSLGMDEPSEEPPLKKFKALFDASHPDNITSGAFDESAFDDVPETAYGSSTQTQTQSQTQAKAGRPGRTGASANLSTLREEEEETQASIGTSRITKRTLDSVQEDVDMENESGSGSRQTKKRAIENVNAVEKVAAVAVPQRTRTATGSKPPSAAASKGGAQPGKPDQDANFLKAIASTKKGKKAEDEFDRDFNKLKISKPVLGREDPADEWALVADFGDDTNVRGNFMVVVEMQAYNRGRKGMGNEPVAEWQGKPNFKKFKKKGEITPSARVEVFINEGGDYGMGASYWKGGKSQVQSQGDFAPTQPKARVKTEGLTQTQTLGKSQAPMIINDSDEEEVPRRGRSKASSRAGSAIPPKRASTRAKAPAKSAPLFLESDEDEIQVADDDDEAVLEDSDEERTLRSTQTNGARRTVRAPVRKIAPILVDDDSDDGAVFKGFKGKQKRR
ncbi:proline-rich protein [Lyophyllum atratum]|nr:proline-rich protein [Lyophyllum atratum]